MKIIGTKKEINDSVYKICHSCCSDYDEIYDCNNCCCACNFLKKHAEIEIEEPKRWRPKKNEEYWCVSQDFDNKYTYTSRCDNVKKIKKESYGQGLMFKTEEEAQMCCEVLNCINTYKMTRDEIDNAIENNFQRYYLCHSIDHGVYGTYSGLTVLNTDYFTEENINKVLNKFSVDDFKKYYFKMVA